MEIIANELQTVLAGANVQFTDTVVPGKACMMHRAGSGLVTLKGVTDQCRARFKVSSGVDIPTFLHSTRSTAPVVLRAFRLFLMKI